MTDDSANDASALPLDWQLAGRTAARLVRPGPVASRDELTHLVEELRVSADHATALVADITGLTRPDPVVRILDRSGWVKANAQLCSTMLGDALTASNEAAARLGAAELATGLAMISGKVLGQFDPYSPSTRGDGGQLLIVAPNVLAVERSIGADSSEFRLWVCVHEQTHAIQFATAPWLVDHLLKRIELVMSDLAQAGAGPKLLDVLSALTKVFRDDREIGEYATTEDDPLMTVLGVALSAEARECFLEISAIMSLLEGHADFIMDAVDRSTIASIDVIRERFDARRVGRSRLERVGRRLLGFDAKIAQYRHGSAFVRTIVDEAGMAGFNEIWAGPERLPTPGEIGDPQAWLRRVVPPIGGATARRLMGGSAAFDGAVTTLADGNAASGSDQMP